jgi:hypothetical protein
LEGEDPVYFVLLVAVLVRAAIKRGGRLSYHCSCSSADG